jgi:hypothetical protein
MNKFAYLMIPILLLSGCSFRPAFSERALSPEISAIEIIPIQTVEGAEFTHYLSSIMPTLNKAKYLLNVSFSHSSQPLIIQKNANILRQNISLEIKYSLIDKNSGKLLTSGKFDNINSYNTTFSPYASHDESCRAFDDLLKKSAYEIRDRIILYFAEEMK